MAGSYETLALELDDHGVLNVTLCRPEVRNAFNAQVIDELHRCFNGEAMAEEVRLVVLRGEGKAFSAGADLNWMKASADLSVEENREGAERMAAMFNSIALCPVPVVASVHGFALGGGAGLVAAADFAIINEEAKIGFTEVRLGIIPSVISPFVLRKIGVVHASRYFCSGEIFDGQEAERIGLAQRAVALDVLEATVHGFIREYLRAGPRAAREAKSLINRVRNLGLEEATSVTAPWIADIRKSKEGQEGMAAFLDKRPASWVPKEEGGRG